MEKSADAFRTISEVADDLALPQHVLRFWETRFPQIRPLKRAGGRRYYRPADVSLLKAIRQLLYDDGYTIKGVQRLLKEQGARGLGIRASGSAQSTEIASLQSDLRDEAEVEHDHATYGVLDDEADQRSAPLQSRHKLIEEALATVDECQRILGALLNPS